MKRKLLRQISNEWRSNIWLCIELMIVSVAIWYMITNIYYIYRVANLPNGYSTDNVYATTRFKTAEYNSLCENLPADELTDNEISQTEFILSTISNMPGVESVGIGNNITLYNYNFYGMDARRPDADSLWLYGNMRTASPEIAEILRFQPLAGTSSTNDIKEMLKRGELIISRSIGRRLTDKPGYLDGLEGAKSLVGEKLVIPNGRTFTVGAVIEDMRRGKYEPADYGNYIWPVRRYTQDVTSVNEILIRVNPAKHREFREAFNNALAVDKLNTPLYYVGEISYLDDVAAAHYSREDTENRNFCIVIIFLLVSIFLGLFGTFWFRTAKRTSEIAIRMTAGATRRNIFNRLISEGILLTLIATPAAAIIDWAIAWYILNFPEIHGYLFSPWEILFVGIAVTLALIMIMTMAGICFPARKAMSIEPATALHNE